MALNKHSNDYVNALRVMGRTGETSEVNGHVAHHSDGLFDDIPKAVWAAIAISALTCGGDHMNVARERVVTEWDILNASGIVPQSVPAKHRHLIDRVMHSGVNDGDGE